LENLDQITSVSQASSEGEKECEKKKRSSEEKEEKVTAELTHVVFRCSPLTRISNPQCANCQYPTQINFIKPTTNHTKNSPNPLA
jgi:hypothetical protein